jgi:hypothetical protein
MATSSIWLSLQCFLAALNVFCCKFKMNRHDSLMQMIINSQRCDWSRCNSSRIHPPACRGRWRRFGLDTFSLFCQEMALVLWSLNFPPPAAGWTPAVYYCVHLPTRKSETGLTSFVSIFRFFRSMQRRPHLLFGRFHFVGQLIKLLFENIHLN